jgi:hypothetical protein
MLSSGSGISSVIHQLSCFEVGFSLCLITGSHFFASPPFSGARSVLCQPAPCCQHVEMICWLLFNFAVLFDFGCCSLAQEMSFVDCYLFQVATYHLPAIGPSAFPALVCWKFTWRSALNRAPPLLQCTCSTPALCCVLVFSSLFIV